MDAARLKVKAELLRNLHDRSGFLILPNAWDVASARIFEDAGFPAIGTPSAGIAYTLGYPDQQRIRRGAEAVARTAAAVRVPVSADMEAGYGDIEGAVRAVLEAGAVGMNLEDATHDGAAPLVALPIQVDRIRAARHQCPDGCVSPGRGDSGERLDHAMLRANA